MDSLDREEWDAFDVMSARRKQAAHRLLGSSVARSDYDYRVFRSTEHVNVEKGSWPVHVWSFVVAQEELKPVYEREFHKYMPKLESAFLSQYIPLSKEFIDSMRQRLVSYRCEPLLKFFCIQSGKIQQMMADRQARYGYGDLASNPLFQPANQERPVRWCQIEGQLWFALSHERLELEE